MAARWARAGGKAVQAGHARRGVGDRGYRRAGESGGAPWATTSPEGVREDVLVCRLAVAEILIRRGDCASAVQELRAVEGRRGGPMHPRTQARVCAIRAEEAIVTGRSGMARPQVERALDVLGTDAEPELALRLCAIGLRAVADDHVANHCMQGRPAPETAGAFARRLMTIVQAYEAGHVPTTDPTATDPIPTPPSSVESAWAALSRAELARLLHLATPRDWAEIARSWRDLREPYLEAYALCRWAQAALAAEDYEGATAVTRACHRLAGAIDARPVLQEVRRLAVRAHIHLEDGPAQGLGGRPDAPGPATSAATHGHDFRLTPRESEVLGHLAQGATNRQIAAALVISEKTAGIHVSNILAKLGVRNRGEAAAVAFRNGLCRIGTPS
jgi:DNA-binding CsgD family transcriptional regulator